MRKEQETACGAAGYRVCLVETATVLETRSESPGGGAHGLR